MRQILFVCTGNICRSPMAAALLRHRLIADGRTDEVRVLSTGTWAVVGGGAVYHARRVMADRGIDLSDHRASEITAEMVDEAALVLTMTASQREAVLAEFPSARGKTYLLSEMVGQHYDIADPYGASPLVYDYTAKELADLIDRGYPRILDLAGIVDG